MRRYVSLLYKIGLCLLGAIGSFGFAPYYLWPLTAISIGAAYYFLKGCGYKYSFWWGAGYAIATFYWCANPMLFDPKLWHFYIAAVVGIFVIFGIVFALPFAMVTATRATGWRRTVYFALAWTFVLWLREWIVFCPWNPLANITLPIAWLANSMSIVGALGLSFILAGCFAAIPEYLASKNKWQFLFFVPLVLFRVICTNVDQGTESGKSVRLIQPLFSRSEKKDKSFSKVLEARLMKLSVEKSRFIPDLIVWPETAYPYDVDITTKLSTPGTMFVTGATYKESGKWYNSVVYASPSGRIVDVYHKVRLIPFGEYRPFADWMPSMYDFGGGAGPKVIDEFAPGICHEIAWSDSLVPKDSSRQAKYIINLANDAWIQGTNGSPQHIDMARRSAIETGLPVLFANNIGTSAIINNRGEVLQSLPQGQIGFIDGIIPPYRETFYRRIGLNRMMLWLILLSGFILVIFKKRDN